VHFIKNVPYNRQKIAFEFIFDSQLCLFIRNDIFRYCVCYIHEEFNRLLIVLKKDCLVTHENCDCDCAFCANGNCAEVIDGDMDLYWFMRHILCKPSKLHSTASRNFFPPRFQIMSLFAVITFPFPTPFFFVLCFVF
jgi:hypothetical protein